MLYVLTTRQTHDLVAFVDDKEKLIESLKNEIKPSSLEEQKELLQSLTEKLKAVAERENTVEAYRDLEGSLDPQPQRSNELQRRNEIENNSAVNNSANQQSQQHTQHDNSNTPSL